MMEPGEYCFTADTIAGEQNHYDKLHSNFPMLVKCGEFDNVSWGPPILGHILKYLKAIEHWVQTSQYASQHSALLWFVSTRPLFHWIKNAQLVVCWDSWRIKKDLHTCMYVHMDLFEWDNGWSCTCWMWVWQVWGSSILLSQLLLVFSNVFADA